MVNLISIGLRGLGVIISGIASFVLELGQIAGALILGLFIGVLIWTFVDLLFGIFQDRPTQGINSGVSLVSAVMPLPYFQLSGSVYIILGLVIGLVIAGVVDWSTKSKKRR